MELSRDFVELQDLVRVAGQAKALGQVSFGQLGLILEPPALGFRRSLGLAVQGEPRQSSVLTILPTRHKLEYIVR